MLNPETITQQNATGVFAEERAWLEEFEKAHGRRLRVLHVGNVANNAFLTAKLLRRVGVDADTLAFDYYHVMATPEWEELELRHDWGDDYGPKLNYREIGVYDRPRYFVQGPMHLCAAYLFARSRHDAKRAGHLWSLLNECRRLVGEGQRPRITDGVLEKVLAELEAQGSSGVFEDSPLGYVKSLGRKAAAKLVRAPHVIGRLIWRAILASLKGSGHQDVAQRLHSWLASKKFVGGNLSRILMASAMVDPPPFLPRFKDLVEEFSKMFPARTDRLTLADLSGYLSSVKILERLFEQYDIVQGYGIDPILPLVTGKRPYVAFEHGTLRDFLRGDNPLHRLNALAYRKANHVFVTNGDCIEHANWLGCPSVSSMIHPIDVDQHETRDDGDIAGVRRQFDTDVLLFCPVRHDWAVKGTDVHIRALPLICKRLSGRVVLVFSPWGLQVEDSRHLIRELQCEDNVVWLDRPLCRLSLIRHMQAADVVLDQMTFPHFGATAPQSLAAGTPVIMSYRPETTAWIVAEPAPILSAFTPQEVADAVVQALDPDWRSTFRTRARAWTHAHHHHNRLIRDHLRVYRRLVGDADDI